MVNKTNHVGYGACAFHGGLNNGQNKYALKLMAKESSLLHGVEMSPEDFIIYAISLAAGEVQWWLEKMREYMEEENDNWKYCLKQRNQALDDGTRYAALALSAGIEERRTQVVEQFAALLTKTIDSVIEGLELDDRQREALPRVLQGALSGAGIVPAVIEPVNPTDSNGG